MGEPCCARYAADKTLLQPPGHGVVLGKQAEKRLIKLQKNVPSSLGIDDGSVGKVGTWLGIARGPIL